MLDRPTDPRPARPKERVVTAFFDRPEAANRAYLQLEAAGIDAKKISVLASRDVAERDLAMVEAAERTKAPEGAASGAAIGAGVGALAGALTIAGAIAIPGIGWVAGPLVGALFGAGAGSVAGGMVGGMVGGLVGAGIPEHEARVVEDAIRRGGVVLAVHATERHVRSIRHVLEKNGGRLDGAAVRSSRA